MKLSNSIIIDKPARQVWKVLAEDFDKAQQWMAAVPVSYKKDRGNTAPNAPMVGRICELTRKPDGPIADETITVFDKDSMILGINVVPRNGNIPVEQNHATYAVKELAHNSTQVSLDSNIELKTKGKLLYPALKIGISKSFKEQLQELKYFVEEGKPHPRKENSQK